MAHCAAKQSSASVATERPTTTLDNHISNRQMRWMSTRGKMERKAQPKTCDRQRIVATLRGKSNGNPITYTANDKDLISYVDYNPPKRNVIVNGGGILRRAFSALRQATYASRQRQVERAIAKYVALRGGRITDDLEREITRHLL